MAATASASQSASPVLSAKRRSSQKQRPNLSRILVFVLRFVSGANIRAAGAALPPCRPADPRRVRLESGPTMLADIVCDRGIVNRCEVRSLRHGAAGRFSEWTARDRDAAGRQKKEQFYTPDKKALPCALRKEPRLTHWSHLRHQRYRRLQRHRKHAQNTSYASHYVSLSFGRHCSYSQVGFCCAFCQDSGGFPRTATAWTCSTGV